MKSHQLFPLLLFVFAFPCHGQVQPQPWEGSLLLAVSDALDHYDQLAPDIHCEDATEKTLRDSCKIVLEMLGKDVKDAKEKIAHYNQVSDPQLADLFDIYQVLQQIMEGIDNLSYASELYGEHNSVLFADAYNHLTKIDSWFGSAIRDAIQETGKRSDCRNARKTG
jgi:hypothetical protein